MILRTITVVGGVESVVVESVAVAGFVAEYTENKTPVIPTLKPAIRIRDDAAALARFRELVRFLPFGDDDGSSVIVIFSVFVVFVVVIFVIVVIVVIIVIVEITTDSTANSRSNLGDNRIESGAHRGG